MYRLNCQGVSVQLKGDANDNESTLRMGRDMYLFLMSANVLDGDHDTSSGNSDYMQSSSGKYFRFRAMTGFEKGESKLFTFEFETNGGQNVSIHRVMALNTDYFGGSIHNEEYFAEGGIFRSLIDDGYMKEGDSLADVFKCDPKSPRAKSLLATGKCKTPSNKADTDHINGRDERACNGWLWLFLSYHQENIIRSKVRDVFNDWLQPACSAAYEGGNKKPEIYMRRGDIPFLSRRLDDGNARHIIEDGDATQLSEEHMRNMMHDTSDIVRPGLPRPGEDGGEGGLAITELLCPALQRLPTERLLARPCIGDDGGLAPELLALWKRNTVRVEGKAGTQLPFRMRGARVREQRGAAEARRQLEEDDGEVERAWSQQQGEEEVGEDEPREDNELDFGGGGDDFNFDEDRAAEDDLETPVDEKDVVVEEEGEREDSASARGDSTPADESEMLESDENACPNTELTRMLEDERLEAARRGEECLEEERLYALRRHEEESLEEERVGQILLEIQRLEEERLEDERLEDSNLRAERLLFEDEELEDDELDRLTDRVPRSRPIPDESAFQDNAGTRKDRVGRPTARCPPSALKRSVLDWILEPIRRVRRRMESY